MSGLGLAALLIACDDAADGAAGDAGAPDVAVADAAVDAGPADAGWPDPTTVFPWVYSPDPDAPSYAFARWETEDWSLMDPTAGLYLQKVLRHYTTAPPEVVAHFEATRPALPPLGDGDEPVISFSGDVLWVGDNWADFGRAAGAATAADLRVANLETVVAVDEPVGKGGLPIRFNAPPEFLDGLPFDVLQLNNNHSLDMDDAGIVSTKTVAESKGYRTTGVDGHVTVDVKGRRVALLSYTWGLNRRDLTPMRELFVVPFGHLDAVPLDRVEADVAAARADGADHVVLLLHWGYEFEYWPDPHLMQLGRQLVTLGADVVVGTGPHVVQPAETCLVNHPEVVPGVGTCSVRTADGVPRTAAILYSLGNFSNDADDRVEVEAGMVAHVRLGDGGVLGMGWTPLIMRHGPPRIEPLARHLDDPEVAEEAARMDAHLGAAWRLPDPE
ncbi:MAG: CapA family protein [Myxococcales bacterium]|nr:CapA family protein [Myxococcales bacterium]